MRSYRTISPLPAEAGGMFLLHFPSARAAQALPGTLPDGVRTFLYETSPQRLPGPLNLPIVAEDVRLTLRSPVGISSRPRVGNDWRQVCRIVQRGGPKIATDSFTCTECGGGFTLPPAVRSKYPNWTPADVHGLPSAKGRRYEVAQATGDYHPYHEPSRSPTCWSASRPGQRRASSPTARANRTQGPAAGAPSCPR